MILSARFRSGGFILISVGIYVDADEYEDWGPETDKQIEVMSLDCIAHSHELRGRTILRHQVIGVRRVRLDDSDTRWMKLREEKETKIPVCVDLRLWTERVVQNAS